MIITSYWIKWADAVRFHERIAEDEELATESAFLEEELQRTYDDAYPDGPDPDLELVIASRFEQNMMNLVDRLGIPHRVVNTETEK